MICPLYEERNGSVRLGVGIQPNVYKLRDGADDEDARSPVASHGKENPLVASGGDHRSQRADNAAVAGATGGRRLRRTGLTQVRRAMKDPGLFAASAGRSERIWDLAGALSVTTSAGGDQFVGGCNQFLREHYIEKFNAKFKVAAEQKTSAFRRCGRPDLVWIFTV